MESQKDGPEVLWELALPFLKECPCPPCDVFPFLLGKPAAINKKQRQCKKHREGTFMGFWGAFVWVSNAKYHLFCATLPR